MSDKYELLTEWLRDAHAMERATIDNIEKLIDQLKHFPEVAARYRQHLEESRLQLERLYVALGLMKAEPSSVKDTVTRIAGKIQPALAGAAEDEPVKQMLAAQAYEAFEAGSYIALIEAARMCGQTEIMELCSESLVEEEAMADFLKENILEVTRLYLSHEQKEQFFKTGT
jgi:ferritin-like metal-binding protein YciE